MIPDRNCPPAFKAPPHIARAHDRRMEADRQYFEQHPRERCYIRPIARWEAWPNREYPFTHVVVIQGDRPGLRWRVPFTLPAGADPTVYAQPLIGEIAVLLTTKFGEKGGEG